MLGPKKFLVRILSKKFLEFFSTTKLVEPLSGKFAMIRRSVR